MRLINRSERTWIEECHSFLPLTPNEYQVHSDTKLTPPVMVNDIILSGRILIYLDRYDALSNPVLGNLVPNGSHYTLTTLCQRPSTQDINERLDASIGMGIVARDPNKWSARQTEGRIHFDWRRTTVAYTDR
jgi:hypothetical protein